MSDEPTPQRVREAAQRRRRLVEIFGDANLEQSADDADESDATDRRTEEQAQDDWLKSQVPPHHG